MINEENVKNEELSENIATEDVAEENTQENQTEEAAIPKDFIDEFEPTSIEIPNYNKEKEMKKMEKASLKKKKSNSKKSQKRRRLIKKIVNISCAVLLSILLLVVSTLALTSAVVRINSSDYAVESAIRAYGPERLIIGKVRSYETLGMSMSADSASLADVLKDNSNIPVTYAFIEQVIDDSTYPEFVSGIATDVIRYLVLGDTYQVVEKEEISNLLYKNASRIRAITGQDLSDQDCAKFADYITRSDVYREITTTKLEKQDIAYYTNITSVLFSLPVLIGAILAFVLVLILVAIACKGYAHKIIGWILVASGLITGAGGMIFKPMYTPATEFVRCVLDAVMAAFHKNSMIYGAVAIAVGILVILIGSVMKDREDDDEIEEYDETDEEYIDETEETATV